MVPTGWRYGRASSSAGSDEKNRMIPAAVTLALGLAGACVVPALEGAMDVETTGGSRAFGALSLAASTVGLIFAGFFAHHATRTIPRWIACSNSTLN